VVILTVLGFGLSLAPTGESLDTGINGVSQSGCNCHGTSASAAVIPSMTLADGSAIPTTYENGATYNLTISFTGGPTGTETNPTALGGFNLRVQSSDGAIAGTLAAIDDSTQVMSNEATHTDAGNDQTSWNITWTAPDDGSDVSFILHVNSVNGNSAEGDAMSGGSSGDEWARFDANSAGIGAVVDELEPANPFKVLATLIVISAVLLVLTLGYTFYRTNPHTFTWEYFQPWITGWLTTTDHKKVGTLYFVAGMFFLGVGGIMALLIRVQLATPGNDFISRDEYNSFFTLHGTTMIFLAAMPLINALANWIVPLQIGAPDLALPRLNAMSFWLQPIAAMLIFTGIFSGQGADTGWTGYAPYVASTGAHAGVTMWIAGQIMLVASSTLTGINFIVTIATMRADGMGWFQIPLFTWSILISVLMLFISIPAFGIGLIQVYLDRTIGTAFYNVAAGGDPLLWSHLFWYFGHPEVYVVIVPAFGVISEIIATSARRSIFGYRSMVYAMAGIGAVAFVVYGHHMFTSGMSPALRFATMVTTMIVAIPTGIKVFNWLKTMHGGSLVYRTHTLWALGFLLTFTLGGISGMFFPAIALDLHLHESYFVVAHFHYVLVGGTVFGLFAAIYYWFPKISGKMLDERLGTLHFLTAFIAYNGIFWPMHRLGVWGMPRRTHTYFISTSEFSSLPPEAADWNMFITVCAFIFFASNLLLVFNIIKTVIKGDPAPNDPWGGWSLEWMTTSPPPTPSFDPNNLPVLKNANHVDGLEDAKFGFMARLGKRLMVPDDSEVNH
jgi:cytochrome c oxidase subunit 1